jgi:predicted ATP-dependent endonuclease of OLD family
MDDHLCRAFFAKKIVIVEGDSEDILFREVLRRFEVHDKDKATEVRANYEVLKARGKATIIPLARYFMAMGLDIHVIHDRDNNTAGAKKFNEPILAALKCETRRTMLQENVEELLGYNAPEQDKPFALYKKTQEWGEAYEDVPDNVKTIFQKVFLT